MYMYVYITRSYTYLLYEILLQLLIHLRSVAASIVAVARTRDVIFDELQLLVGGGDAGWRRDVRHVDRQTRLARLDHTVEAVRLLQVLLGQLDLAVLLRFDGGFFKLQLPFL